MLLLRIVFLRWFSQLVWHNGNRLN